MVVTEPKAGPKRKANDDDTLISLINRRERKQPKTGTKTMCHGRVDRWVGEWVGVCVCVCVMDAYCTLHVQEYDLD